MMIENRANHTSKKKSNRLFLKLKTTMSKYFIVLIFLVLILVFSTFSPNFLSISNLRSMLIQTSMLSIVAFGMTIVMIGGGVDLSVGSVAGLSTIFAVSMMVYSGVPIVLGVLLGLSVGAGIGLLNGLLVARFGVAPFVATLSTMFIAQGLQFSIRHGESIGFGFPPAYLSMGSGTSTFLGIPIPIFIFIVILVIMVFLTEFTTYGRYIRSTGLNQDTSKFSGIRIRMLTLSTYVIAGVLAAFSGLILGASQSYIQPNIGDSFLLDSLVVALLGKAAFSGYASILGTVFGAFFLKSLETGMAMLGAPGMVLNISKGALLIAVLLLSLFQRKMATGRMK